MKVANRNLQKLLRFPVWASAKVAGGFPVLAVGTVSRHDPSVGIMSGYAEELDVYTLNGGNAEFIKRKMTKNDWDNVALALEEAA